jgi:hypothetical protein
LPKGIQSWGKAAIHHAFERIGPRSVSDYDYYGHAFIWRASRGSTNIPALVREVRLLIVQIRR